MLEYTVFAAAVAILMFHLISPKRFAEARLARWLQLIVINLGEGWANHRYGTGGLGCPGQILVLGSKERERKKKRYHIRKGRLDKGAIALVISQAPNYLRGGII